MANRVLWFIILIAVASPFQGICQQWKVSYQPEKKLEFHITQKEGKVFITKNYTDFKVFVRITDGWDNHSRYYFEGASFLSLELPEEGFIALMSEDEASKTQYIYASERISQINYVDNNDFFAYAEYASDPPPAESPEESIDKSSSQLQENSFAGDRDGNPARPVAIVTSSEHNGFDPYRETGEATRSAPASHTDRASAVSAEEYMAQMMSLTQKIDRLTREVQSLKGEIAESAAAPEGGIINKPLGKYNFIMEGSAGYLRVDPGCESCDVQQATGVPVIGSAGVALNYPRFSLAVMLSAGLQMHRIDGGNFGTRLRPTAGGKMLLITDKMAFSTGLLSTRNLDSIILKTGIGIPVSSKIIAMMEAGYFVGHMSAFPSRQISSTVGLSLVYNFRKYK